MNITTVKEYARGCGFRKPGLYLRSDGTGRDCGKLPITMKVCPTCHGGIKPSRGWTWVNGLELIKNLACGATDCVGCILATKSTALVRVGLLWIGEKYYTPQSWLAESRQMGVSRRLPAIPKGFKTGETWVFAAHRKVLTGVKFGDKPEFAPAVFHIFQPDRIEYVVGINESPKKLEAMEKRGVSLVKVITLEEEMELDGVKT